MLPYHPRIMILMVLIPRQGQAGPSTSDVHITMPLPPANEVIKNKWVGVLVDPSLFVHLRNVGLCTQPRLPIHWGVTELCFVVLKQSASYLGLIYFQFLIPTPSETRPLLPKPTHLEASASTKNVGDGQVALSYPLNPWETTRTPFQSMGWRHITLPDNSVYFYHPTLRVTTDIDLRTPNKLDAVTSYLQENSIDESFLPPEGWESWLVDSNVGKKYSLKPISSWVNHAEKILTFASPSLPQSREVSTAKALDDDRTLAACFAYTTECSIQRRSRSRIPLLGLHGVSPRSCVSPLHRSLRRIGCINLVVYR